MTDNLKMRFEALAAGGTLVEGTGSKGWGNSGNSGGGHTGHDGKYKRVGGNGLEPGKLHIVMEEKPKGPPPKKSLTNLP